ncbi:MAG: RNA polymerase-binding transcription factor DksA [Steroidobacteraceae bacterium]|nr:RNA polymerase-binding transcription factor DksA [Steroidobacteraceae bacterium]
MPAKKAPAKSSKPKKTSVKSPPRPAVKAAVRKSPVRARIGAPKSPKKVPAAVAKPATPKSPAPVEATFARRSPEPDLSVIRTAARTVDADDAEAQEGVPNLLAGPRNVQPYIARRGEQYMGKAQLEHFRDILQGWKQDLMMEVDRTVSHMKDEAANFPDPNDRATQEEEFSLELRTRDRERKLIRKIDDALKRIEDGSYGYCLETGEEIGIKRLEARPVATLSLEAQERRERRERQYGDRDDRYR